MKRILVIFLAAIMGWANVSWAGDLNPEKLEKYFSKAMEKANESKWEDVVEELKKAREDLDQLEKSITTGGRIPRMLRVVVKQLKDVIKIVESGKPRKKGWIQNASQQANLALAMYLCRQDSSRYRCRPRQCLTSVGNYHAIHQPQDEEGCR